MKSFFVVFAFVGSASEGAQSSLQELYHKVDILFLIQSIFTFKSVCMYCIVLLCR